MSQAASLSLDALKTRLSDLQMAVKDPVFRKKLAASEHLDHFPDVELIKHYENTALTYQYIINQKYHITS